MTVLLEACVDDVMSVDAAIAGGADRMELCDNLGDGGTTPSLGMAAWALARSSLPVYPIIRCRGGGFVYSEAEQEIMLDDLCRFRELGCHGVVIGALTSTGDVDTDFVVRAAAAAGTMELTFHRAFDVCRDPLAAIDTLIDMGVRRILTSGQSESVWAGRELIAELVRLAAGRITIMAGGGVNEATIADVVAATGVTEVHFRGGRELLEAPAWSAPAVSFRKALPENEAVRMVTDVERIRKVKEAIGGFVPPLP